MGWEIEEQTDGKELQPREGMNGLGNRRKNEQKRTVAKEGDELVGEQK